MSFGTIGRGRGMGPEARGPHPATVAQRRAPMGGGKVLPPHPATVLQAKQTAAGGKVLPPHPATVVQTARR